MARPLRIAQVVPMSLAVSETTTASIHHLAYLMTEELVRRGHQVTLVATGDSQTSARLLARYERGYESDSRLWDWRFHESMHVATAFEHAAEFDVIHSHVYHFALPFARLTPTPVLHTYHVMPDEDVIAAYGRLPGTHVVAISKYQAMSLPGIPVQAVIHHGIHIASFPFEAHAEKYLLFLGRVIPRKGPLEAIEVARRAGMRLIIAGHCEEWYLQQLKPHMNGHDVQYLGAVDAPTRNRLLSQAGALLFPLQAGEPFGLVMIEAMACGTPVVALNCGPVAEIVDPGVTGFYANDVDGLAAMIPAAMALDRKRIRAEAEARWDYSRMVDQYEELYRELADCGSRSTGT